MVIPKALREEVGLTEGEIELVRDGAGIRIEPVAGTGTIGEAGRKVIGGDIELDDEAVRAARLADQR